MLPQNPVPSFVQALWHHSLVYPSFFTYYNPTYVEEHDPSQLFLNSEYSYYSSDLRCFVPVQHVDKPSAPGCHKRDGGSQRKSEAV